MEEDRGRKRETERENILKFKFHINTGNIVIIPATIIQLVK